MKNILVVISSTREGRVADTILPLITDELTKNKDVIVTIADFKAMPLPFFDSAIIPSGEGFAPTDENVIAWTKMVSAADGVILLVAEYNHTLTAVLKNAIDWIYAEWENKPVAFIGYGWVGGARAINHLHDVMTNLKSTLLTPEANLSFTKEINTDGTPIDETVVKGLIAATVQPLTA